MGGERESWGARELEGGGEGRCKVIKILRCDGGEVCRRIGSILI